MGLVLTESAAEEVKKLMSEHHGEADMMLRVGVVGGGCSGLSYDLRFDDQFDEKNDKKSEQHGVTMVIDRKSSLYLDGTTVDYYRGIDAQGFQFNNPNAVRSCGCGSSFQA